METSDVHSNLLSFDYYQNKRDDSLGLARTALLIKQARDENSNNLLIDNADLIQGTPCLIMSLPNTRAIPII